MIRWIIKSPGMEWNQTSVQYFWMHTQGLVFKKKQSYLDNRPTLQTKLCPYLAKALLKPLSVQYVVSLQETLPFNLAKDTPVAS